MAKKSKSVNKKLKIKAKDKIKNIKLPKLKKINLKKIKIGTGKTIIIAAVLVVVTFLTTIGYLLYGAHNQSPFLKRVVAVAPYPAAFVDGSYISAYSYLDHIDIIKSYYQEIEGTDFNSEEGKDILTNIKSEVMNRLIEDALIKKEAARRDISISQDEFNESFDQLVTSSGGQEEFMSVLNKYYGMTVDKFKDKI